VQKVHVDSLSKCVDVFVKSLTYAGLGNTNGDQVTLNPITINPATSDKNTNDNGISDDHEDTIIPDPKEEEPTAEGSQSRGRLKGMTNQSSDFRVNITIDPTMDPEKLEKHLSLLKRYGVI
jgi:hypothetical protein